MDERSRDPYAKMDAIADEIGRVGAHVSAATHRLLTLIREFDEGGGWQKQGALTCAHWLNWRIGLGLPAAREHVRVAKALGGLPKIDEGLRTAVLSYSKVRALTRVATPATETVLYEMALCATASQLERICRKYAQCEKMAAKDRGEHAEDEDRRFVRHWPTDRGMVRIEALLHADEADVVLRALEAARLKAGAPAEPPPRPPREIRDRELEAEANRGRVSAETAGYYSDEDPFDDDTSRRRSGARKLMAPLTLREQAGYARRTDADALVLMAESFLAGEPQQRTGGARVQMIVHVDAATLTSTGPTSPEQRAELEHDKPIAAETARRLACDTSVVVLTEDAKGEAVDIGRRSRTIPAPMRRALAARDRGCRFPGCMRKLFVEGHHLKHWAHGGATALHNLVQLCALHHRAVHELGFRVERTDDGCFVFFHPKGGALPAHPTDPIEDGMESLLCEHEDAGLDLDEDDLTPRGWGECDLDLAVGAIFSADEAYRRRKQAEEGRTPPIIG